MSNRWILSATEIETFQTCKRKWAFRYIDQIEVKPSASAQLGNLVHQALENYLVGNPIDVKSHEGRIASAGLHYLPEAIPKENVERHILFSSDGLIFQGYIDFFHHLGSQTWLLGDHKTCSSFASSLDKNELKHNTQANIYAHWLFQERNAQTVKLRWIYYRTKGIAQAQCVEAELDKEEALKNFQPILKTAAEIKELIEKKAISAELPKNTAACFKYGPCPFYSHCKSDQKISPTITKKEENESALSSRNTGSFHLYIDCVPTKSETAYQRTIDLSELLKPVLSQIQTDKQLSHYRLAGYGQHVGLIANYLENHLNEQHYDSNTAILSSFKSPEGCDTIQTLSKAAGQIVRGF